MSTTLILYLKKRGGAEADREGAGRLKVLQKGHRRRHRAAGDWLLHAGTLGGGSISTTGRGASGEGERKGKGAGGESAEAGEVLPAGRRRRALEWGLGEVAMATGEALVRRGAAGQGATQATERRMYSILGFCSFVGC